MLLPSFAVMVPPDGRPHLLDLDAGRVVCGRQVMARAQGVVSPGSAPMPPGWCPECRAGAWARTARARLHDGSR